MYIMCWKTVVQEGFESVYAADSTLAQNFEGSATNA